MFSSITAFFTAISEFFKFKTKKQDKLVENTHINDYNDLHKACQYAEEAFEYIEKHATVDFETFRQQRRYASLVEKFRQHK